MHQYTKEDYVSIFKDTYLNKKVNLLEMDNEVCGKLKGESIFDHNFEKMLFINKSFCYGWDGVEGINFELEVVEGDVKHNANIESIYVKVIHIDLI